jgi:allantoicase
MFFGSRNNLIKPGPSLSMADGWETRRRRGPGNDWAIVRLATTGTIERVEIDTSHFKGNAPGRCVLEGQLGTDAGGGPTWRTILATPLQPHTRHVFDAELRRIGPTGRVRLSVFPDGGVARLRVWGGPDRRRPDALAAFDSLSPEASLDMFLRCCGSHAWAITMSQLRPFEDRAALMRTADRVWWSLDEAAWLEAFAAHPRIGQKAPPPALPTAGGDPSRWAAQEQRSTATASPALMAELAAANDQYFGKHGFIYIVCASGRAAADMLSDLGARLGNDRATEIRTAAEEQAKITRLRLDKLLQELTP